MRTKYLTFSQPTINAIIETLESRRLLTAVGPQEPALTALAIDADTIRLSYSKPDDSVLSLEMKGPGDANYRVISSSLNQTAGTHTLDIDNLAASRSYSFRLRAALNGAVAYDEAEARTESLWQADPSPSLPKPEVTLVTFPYGRVDFSFADGPYPTYAPDDPWAAFEVHVELIGTDPFGLFEYYYFDWFNPELTDGSWSGELSVDYSPYPYEFRLKVDSWFDSSPWSDWTSFNIFSPNTPAAPELSIAPASGGNVTISWNDVWNDNNAYLHFYRIIGDEATLIGDVEADDGSIVLPIGAVDSQIFAATYIAGYGFSVYSNFLAADGVPTAPAAPGDPSAHMADQDDVRLIWDNVSRDEKGYIIERKLHSAGAEGWAVVGQVGADVSVFGETLPDPELIYDYRVKSFNDVGESAPVAAGTVSGIFLKTVDFNDTITISRDSGGGAYTGPAWHDGNLDGTINPGPTTPFSNGTIDWDAGTAAETGDDERRYPVAYARSVPGTPKLIGADIALNFGGTAGTGWKVRASGGGFTFATVDLAGGGAGLTGSLVSAEALPETIDSRKLKITWQVSLDGGVSWFTAGQTENHLYVTGAAVDSAFETVLHLGSEGAKGLRPRNPGELAEDANVNGVLDAGEDSNGNGVLDDEGAAKDREVVDAVWAEFSDREVKRVDGTLMKYNHDNAVLPDDPGAGSTAAEMLRDASGRGRCTAWAELLVQTLGIHGIAASSNKISWDFRVKDGPAQGSGGVNYPHTAFNLHQITRIDIYPDRIFDPSYGTLTIASGGRSVNLTWEHENVVELLRDGIWVPYTKGTDPELIYH